MRATLVSTILGLCAAVLAQDLSALPVCAQTAALGAASSTGCTATDVACLCQNFGSLQGAIQVGCTSVSDQQAACAWGNSACATYGVSIPCDTAAELDTNTTAGTPSEAATADPVGPTDMATPTATDADEVGPTATDSDVSLISGSPTNGMMSSTTGTDMDTGSMTLMTTSMMTIDMTNGTIATHMSGNMTHSSTMSMSAMGSGPTSMYTGAANQAVRLGGIFGASIGAAALFAFF